MPSLCERIKKRTRLESGSANSDKIQLPRLLRPSLPEEPEVLRGEPLPSARVLPLSFPSARRQRNSDAVRRTWVLRASRKSARAGRTSEQACGKPAAMACGMPAVTACDRPARADSRTDVPACGNGSDGNSQAPGHSNFEPACHRCAPACHNQPSCHNGCGCGCGNNRRLRRGRRTGPHRRCDRKRTGQVPRRSMPQQSSICDS